MITVGRIVRPHGIKGAVVVAPESDFAAERFRAGRRRCTWQRAGDARAGSKSRQPRVQGRWIVSSTA